MIPDAISFYQAFFANIWRLFTSFYIPGTRLTPGALIVGLFMIGVFSKALKMLFGIGGKNEDVKNEKSE